MPMLGDIFINNVVSESYDEGVNTTDHPIEGGKEVTDHIEQQPVILKISGVVAGPDAAAKLEKLRLYMRTGKLLKYSYRSVISNVIIEKFPHDHVVQVRNGFEFQITLKQIRIAKVGVIKHPAKPKKTAPKSNKGRQQPTKPKPAKVYVVVKGDNLTKIGKKYNMTWKKIYDKNKGVIGSNPNLIFPGQKLVIPA